MTLTGLATACATTSWASAPRPVRERVVDLVADCVAVSALGSGRAELRRLVTAQQATTSAGTATVVGSPHGWPAVSAMFLNGAAVAADQLQDGHRLARGHPASHVVPAVLALGEEHGCSGEDTLSAVLAGYETGVRVGKAMGGTPAGVHDIGTWGAVGVAAAVARLLAPADVDAARRAIDLAASAVLLTDAATVFAGRTGGHAFLGASIQLGASLGSAAVAGLEPLEGALDHHFAGLAARGWDGRHLRNVGGYWPAYEVLAGYVKTHPTCAHLHGVNDAVADLLAVGRPDGKPLRDEEVERIDVRTFSAAAAFDSVADDELAARFSVPTSVAVALVTGRLDETTLTDETVRSEAVQDLASRVTVTHDAALDKGYPDGRPAVVRLVLRDGTELEARADRPRGDAGRDLSREELQRKATRLLASRFGSSGDDVLRAIHALADGGSPRDVGRSLREAAR